MTKYREILRLHSQGISSRNIAASLECSRNTIRVVLARATEEGITWPLPDEMTGRALEQTLFGKHSKSRNYKMPDLGACGTFRKGILNLLLFLHETQDPKLKPAAQTTGSRRRPLVPAENLWICPSFSPCLFESLV
jgi:hypothetical protein